MFNSFILVSRFQVPPIRLSEVSISISDRVSIWPGWTGWPGVTYVTKRLCISISGGVRIGWVCYKTGLLCKFSSSSEKIIRTQSSQIITKIMVIQSLDFPQPFQKEARLTYLEHAWDPGPGYPARFSFVNWIIFEWIPCGLLVRKFWNKAPWRVTPEGEINTKPQSCIKL